MGPGTDWQESGVDMSNSNTSQGLNKFIAPVIGLGGALIALFLPWATADSSYGNSASLYDAIELNGMPQEATFWITVAGLVVLWASVFIVGPNRKLVAVLGSLALVVYPIAYTVDFYRFGLDDWGVTIGIGMYLMIAVAIVATLVSMAVETTPFQGVNDPALDSGFIATQAVPGVAHVGSDPTAARTNSDTWAFGPESSVRAGWSRDDELTEDDWMIDSEADEEDSESSNW